MLFLASKKNKFQENNVFQDSGRPGGAQSLLRRSRLPTAPAQKEENLYWTYDVEP